LHWFPNDGIFLLQLQEGVSGARSNDTKSLKSIIIDWISPPGEPLRPPIARNIKTDRGFNHETTAAPFILDLLDDPDEVNEVDDLLAWWNW
jgi:hypothetical protein